MRVVLKADAVRALAARQGATLSDIAERSGLSATHLSRALAGKHELTPRKRLALLAALGVDFDAAFEIEATPVAKAS